ncbi:ATP-binding cassette domain-containing protein [Phytoactinopolyspora sp. XMNu-373]|uniref:ATP-binding cassette domain-containing protein n=2 Tax=Phytoactinopolyspora mesophila TaxID=2650750 RepID=A0A7K3LWW3_9ACTN|nr:ATP-binding cassette domain-containing protein [Phytoactinopolyspora mesophila]
MDRPATTVAAPSGGSGRQGPHDRPVLIVRNFSAEVGGEPIVRPLSFEVRPGQALALVGESGSGKTTTGLAIAGEHADGVTVHGEIVIEDPGGENPGDERSANASSRVGYIPQHPASVLAPARRVGAVLREAAATHVPRGCRGRARRERIDRLVRRAVERARVGRADVLLCRYPHELSGGQQQRIVLAQALVGDPALVVADEPTTGQDPANRAAIVAEFERLLSEGVALVLLSHDLEVVRRLSSESIVLRRGAVVERGARVWTAPRHEYTRQLIEASGLGAGMSAELPARARTIVVRTAGLAVQLGSGRRVTEVLRGIDVTVGDGECVAVVGESGAGKTTLARCIAGLRPPSEGTVQIMGRVVAAHAARRSANDLAACQYVFQDARASFAPFRTVGDQAARTAVRLRGLEHRAAYAEAQELADRVGLGRELLSRHVDELSGGELQRAALVRALLARPKVLVCDEITSGLDVVTREHVLGLLASLRDDGLALLVVTHEAAVARRLAHRVVEIADGRVLDVRESFSG